MHFVRRRFGRCLWDSVEIAQNSQRTTYTEHASKKKIRPSKRLELYIFLIFCALLQTCICALLRSFCVRPCLERPRLGTAETVEELVTIRGSQQASNGKESSEAFPRISRTKLGLAFTKSRGFQSEFTPTSSPEVRQKLGKTSSWEYLSVSGAVSKRWFEFCPEIEFPYPLLTSI